MSLPLSKTDYQNLFFSPESSAQALRDHSVRVDEVLGFRMQEIERELLHRARELSPAGSLESWGAGLHDGNQTWVGLCAQTLNTPYSELQDFCQRLKPEKGMRLLDLGAGYGRLGLVLHYLYPGVEYLGLEYVVERVAEGRRVLRMHHCGPEIRLVEADLRDPELELPLAQAYFIYDFGTLADIRRVLSWLEAEAAERSFKVVARGNGTRSLIQHEHPWLTRLHDPYHGETFSIYRS